MNKLEIANLFIRAAIIDRRLPINASPARLKAAWVSFVHSREDINQWRRTNERKEQLHPTDDPLEEWFTKFWSEDGQRLKVEDIADWEKANELIKLVANEDNRKALWNWAKAKAESLQASSTISRKTRNRKTKTSPFGTVTKHHRTHRGASFADWCRSQGFHEMTGSRRKDRALSVIEQQLVRSGSSNVETGNLPMLPTGPVLEHISVNIEADVPNRKERFVHRDADTVFCKEATVFNWQEMRNADRRRAAARKKQAA